MFPVKTRSRPASESVCRCVQTLVVLGRHVVGSAEYRLAGLRRRRRSFSGRSEGRSRMGIRGCSRAPGGGPVVYRALLKVPALRLAPRPCEILSPSALAAWERCSRAGYAAGPHGRDKGPRRGRRRRRLAPGSNGRRGPRGSSIPTSARFYDVSQHEGVTHLVMHHLEGETLAERWQRSLVTIGARC